MCDVCGLCVWCTLYGLLMDVESFLDIMLRGWDSFCFCRHKMIACFCELLWFFLIDVKVLNAFNVYCCCRVFCVFVGVSYMLYLEVGWVLNLAAFAVLWELLVYDCWNSGCWGGYKLFV